MWIYTKYYKKIPEKGHTKKRWNSNTMDQMKNDSNTENGLSHVFTVINVLRDALEAKIVWTQTVRAKCFFFSFFAVSYTKILLKIITTTTTNTQSKSHIHIQKIELQWERRAREGKRMKCCKRNKHFKSSWEHCTRLRFWEGSYSISSFISVLLIIMQPELSYHLCNK